MADLKSYENGPTGPAKPNPKRHHFVAQMLQRQFADAGGRLYAFSKKSSQGDIFTARPGNLFLETQLYAKQGADGAHDVAMEAHLSALESDAAPIIDKIISAARAGDAPELHPAETEVWLRFFMVQWKRVPDLHLEVTTDAQVSAELDALITELRDLYPEHSDELDRLSRPEVRRRMIQNARIDILGMPSPDVIDALRSRGLGIARITRPDKRFVLASRPVVKLTRPGKTHIRHPECEMWLAIAPDVLVGLGPGQGQEKLVGVRDPKLVRDYNLASTGQSTMFASGSRALVRSLARPR